MPEENNHIENTFMQLETAVYTGEIRENMDLRKENSIDFIFQDNNGKTPISLPDILQYLRSAGKENILPVFPAGW